MPPQFIQLPGGDYINLYAVAYLDVWGSDTDAVNVHWIHDPQHFSGFYGDDAKALCEAFDRLTDRE